MSVSAVGHNGHPAPKSLTTPRFRSHVSSVNAAIGVTSFRTPSPIVGGGRHVEKTLPEISVNASAVFTGRYPLLESASLNRSARCSSGSLVVKIETTDVINKETIIPSVAHANGLDACKPIQCKDSASDDVRFVSIGKGWPKSLSDASKNQPVLSRMNAPAPEINPEIAPALVIHREKTPRTSGPESAAIMPPMPIHTTIAMLRF